MAWQQTESGNDNLIPERNLIVNKGSTRAQALNEIRVWMREQLVPLVTDDVINHTSQELLESYWTQIPQGLHNQVEFTIVRDLLNPQNIAIHRRFITFVKHETEYQPCINLF